MFITYYEFLTSKFFELYFYIREVIKICLKLQNLTYINEKIKYLVESSFNDEI